MSPVVANLIPVFLIIVTGAILRHRGPFDGAVWSGLEKATYHIFFPAIIIVTLAKADLMKVPLVEVGASLLFGVLAMAGIMMVLRRPLARHMSMDGPAFASMFQGATRWNSFVAIATSGALYGSLGLTLTAIGFAVMVPILNIMAVFVHARYARGEAIALGPTLKAIIANPFIWSTLIGTAINASGLTLPKPIITYGDILGQAALGAGLLLVGAGLDVRAALRPRALTWVATALKLLGMPALVGASLALFAVSGVPMNVAILCAAMPTASGSYILARQLGGDAPLMAEILTVQTLLAMATIPILLWTVGG